MADNTQWDADTSEQLIEMMKEKRRQANARVSRTEKPETAGTELFFDTRRGRVRVLGYHLDAAGILPLYVNMHGGGFVAGSAEMDDPFMPRVAADAGVRIFNVDYSLAPERPFPSAIEECYEVVRFAREHASKFGIDPGRIAAGGHSAGGNFAAALALMDAERRELDLRALILDYPPLDVYTDGAEKPRYEDAILPDISRLYDACYMPARENRKNPLVSPVYASDEALAQLPPTLVITAGRDSLREEAEAFAVRLMHLGVEVTYRCFLTSTHGFTHQPVPQAQNAWRLIINHLKTALHPHQ